MKAHFDSNKMKWVAQVDGTRVFEFYLGPDGLHCQQLESLVGSGVHHKEEVLSFSDAVAKAENQMTLPL